MQKIATEFTPPPPPEKNKQKKTNEDGIREFHTDFACTIENLNSLLIANECWLYYIDPCKNSAIIAFDETFLQFAKQISCLKAPSFTYMIFCWFYIDGIH